MCVINTGYSCEEALAGTFKTNKSHALTITQQTFKSKRASLKNFNYLREASV